MRSSFKSGHKHITGLKKYSLDLNAMTYYNKWIKQEAFIWNDNNTTIFQTISKGFNHKTIILYDWNDDKV